jgi:hypothetical protein
VSRRLSGADDPHPPFVLDVAVCMNDDKDDDRTDHSNRVPSLFSILETVGDDDVERIFPNHPRQLERNAMLDAILARLLRVPLKFHNDLILQNCKYKPVINQKLRRRFRPKAANPSERTPLASRPRFVVEIIS